MSSIYGSESRTKVFSPCGALPPLYRKNAEMNPAQNFLTALALLTRLGPARRVGPDRIAASLVWYPAVGALLGALALLPPLCLFSDLPWIQAWIYTGTLLYLTRGLHWDGLADLADALGSGAKGDAFWAVLKDSRAGVCGVLTACFCLLGMVLAAQALFSAGAFAPLLLAPIAGRSVCVLLAGTGAARSAASLAAPIIAGADPFTRAFVCAAALLPCALCFNCAGLCVLAAGAGLVLARLYALSREHGGLNGDFLGASVVLTELITLLAGSV